MKFELVYPKGQSEKWVELAATDYVQKISYMYPIERKALRSRSADRGQKDEKKRAEGQSLLESFSGRDYVIAFDEKGEKFKSSIEFSQMLQKAIAQQKNKIVFLLGGPYGIDQAVKDKADKIISLGSLTFSHHVAHVVVLEQIYRALAIWKGLPYHNP